MAHIQERIEERTPFQIAYRAVYKSCSDLGETREINRQFREQDESHKFPINGRFNATDRAIRRVSRRFIDNGWPRVGEPYAEAVDAEISRIVNEEGA